VTHLPALRLLLCLSLLAGTFTRPAAAEPSTNARSSAVSTNTSQVSALLLLGDDLWVASEGGYELTDGRRTGWWTRLDGLAETRVLGLAVEGGPVAITRSARCRVNDSGLQCKPAKWSPSPPRRLGRVHHGSRVVDEAQWQGQTIVATAGEGVWLGERRLTPEGQLCGNHVTALVRHEGRLHIGTFEDGVCRQTATGFETIGGLPRQINALRSTAAGLYVATSNGLWLVPPLGDPRQLAALQDAAVTSLSLEGDTLLATTVNALWKLQVADPDKAQGQWRPGGSRSLQRVASDGRNLWLATEDRGVIARRGREMRVFDQTRGARSSWALDVLPDGKGGAWVATLRDGLEHRGPTSSLGVALEDTWGLCLLAGEHQLYYGTQSGLFLRPHGAPIDQWDSSAPLVDPRVHSLLEEETTLWVGTELGLQQLPRP
jgi:hypothetical protein